MISFRKKRTEVVNLIPDALRFFKERDIKVNKISSKDADKVSRTNSKSMVLVSFQMNDEGRYQIQIQDKELYRYTQKLIREYFRMRILNIDTTNRIITADCDHEGICYDILEILGLKYNLSVVVD